MINNISLLSRSNLLTLKNVNVMNLSKQEFKVSAYISAGYEVKEIADKTFKSYHTIASQVKSIKSKNSLRNLAEITREFVLEFGNPSNYLNQNFNN